ncbi:AAA family ATPase [Longirhabdus pacifica]|uniref:AAA family ATPase n=1 Tax=Longirhabdus pacifica TaxID=2305227 RepID=UPI001008B590|nr:AAA family ATPase [Longirhabdus pacifica]
MIVMINGAFGVGKTTVANQLLSKLENSMIFDPEMIGMLLREMLPASIRESEASTGDFQDFVLWRQQTVTTADQLISLYKTTLIVPMTIRNIHYFQYNYDGFKAIDPDTYHFCLMASESTITDRLKKRGETEGNWCFQQTKKCLHAFEGGQFQPYINTEHKHVDDVVDEIMSQINMQQS